MKRTLFVLAVAFSFAAQAESTKGPAFADRIVGDVAGVKEGELVMIQGSFDDAVLMKELFVAVARRGALPMMRIEDATVTRKWFDEVPAARDDNIGATERKVAALPDVLLAIDRRDHLAVFKGVAPERTAKWTVASNGVEDVRFKRGVRQVWIGNGMFPTRVAAQEAGASQGELKNAFEAGLAADPKVLAARGAALAKALAPGKTVKVTTKGGTDVTFKMAKPMIVSDGVIDAADVKAGGAALLTWLPAGEASAVIDPTSGEGTIRVPRVPFEGEDVKDVVMVLKGGKLVSISGKPSKAFDRFKAFYEAMNAYKESLTLIDIGLNDAARVKGKPLWTFVPAGNVMLSIGGDAWAGGTNMSTMALQTFFADATVTADGVVVIDNGVLK